MEGSSKMKIKMAMFFGGKSVEHEISVITANQAYASINKEKYEIIPIYISKKGLMYTGEGLFDLNRYKKLEDLISTLTQVTIVNDGKNVNVVEYPMKKFGNSIINTIDIAFPIMHGTNGEDGTIQGFLELMGVTYIGPDIVASSVGMDKIMMKKILKASDVPVVDFVAFYALEYVRKEDELLKEIEEKLKYPVIVKPANLGSSVGISKANNRDELMESIENATQFSDRIIVEKAISKLREINCSVIGNQVDCEPSVCEEPVFSDDILSYEDKYTGGGKGKLGNKTGQKAMAASQKKLPADLTDDKRIEIENLAMRTFKTLGASGVARIDFLMDSANNDTVYVNEINTIPGALSYYLWEKTGKTFEKEIDDLVDIALKRQRNREGRVYTYDQNILALTGGKIGGAKGKMK